MEEFVVRNLRETERNGTRFAAIRFGNVLGARGSVGHFLKLQIGVGGPVTVTHPDMKRYFMTIPEAVHLVIQAGALGREGEVFVLDMGEPVRIVDLAENLIRLSGLDPGKDIAVEFVGPRPGGMLFEELLTAEEGTDSTQHQRIFVARGASWETDGWDEKFAEFAARFGEMRRGGSERGQERRGGESGHEWMQEHPGEHVQEHRGGERIRGRVQDLLRQLVPTYHPEQAAAQVETSQVAAARER